MTALPSPLIVHTVQAWLLCTAALLGGWIGWTLRGWSDRT